MEIIQEDVNQASDKELDNDNCKLRPGGLFLLENNSIGHCINRKVTY